MTCVYLVSYPFPFLPQPFHKESLKLDLGVMTNCSDIDPILIKTTVSVNLLLVTNLIDICEGGHFWERNMLTDERDLIYMFSLNRF
jgi:hypothetical protein